LGGVARFQVRFQSGFIAPISKLVSGSVFNATSKAVSVLAKWPSFIFGFKVLAGGEYLLPNTLFPARVKGLPDCPIKAEDGLLISLREFVIPDSNFQLLREYRQRP